MTTEIKLSNNVLIPCPETGFALRRVARCMTCKHYMGIMKATVNDKSIPGNEADDFQIICGRPITRKLIKIMDE